MNLDFEDVLMIGLCAGFPLGIIYGFSLNLFVGFVFHLEDKLKKKIRKSGKEKD